MFNKSDYLRDKFVNHIRGVVYTPPSALFIALYNVAPTSAGGGTEVSGSGYVRKAVTLTPSSGGTSGNTLSITYNPTGDWNEVVAAALFDAASAGNMLYFGNLGTPRTLYSGDDVYYPPGYFNITES